MEKLKSVGVVYTDGERFLSAISYGSGKVGLPKGLIDGNESYEETAQREFYEETGVMLPKKHLVFLGEFPYLKNKDLVLFKHVVPQKVMPVELMRCLSYFNDGKGGLLPEIESYKYINIDNYTELSPSYHKIFEKIKDKLKK